MIQVATPQDIEKIVEDKIRPVEERLLRAIEQIGKPEYMTLEEASRELSVVEKTASRRLKKAYRQGLITDINWDSRPILINRKEFFNHIMELS